MNTAYKYYLKGISNNANTMSSTPHITKASLLQSITLRASASVGVLTPALAEAPMQHVFVSSRYRGAIKRHVADARLYCQYVIDQGYLPLCGHLYFIQWTLDHERGVKLCCELLRLSDEIWLFVTDKEPTLSDGMRLELLEATRLKLKIRFFTYHQGGIKSYGAYADGVSQN